MFTVVGDRFVRMTGGWVDLASGASVEMRLGRAPDDLDRRRRRCESAYGLVSYGGAHLVDFGPTGIDGWFEAYALGSLESPAFSLRRLWRPALSAIDRRATDPEWRGVQHLRLVAPHGSGATIAMLDWARLLRQRGFVTVRADRALPQKIRQPLCHRHLVVIVPNAAAREAGAAWAAQLAAASDRGHLLIERVLEEDHDIAERAVGEVRVEPCAREELIGAYVSGAVTLSGASIEEAADASGGWPGRFARLLAERSDLSRATGARERAGAIAAEVVPGPWPFSVSLRVDDAATDSRLLRRAGRLHRQGRARSGERWLTAALEASRRRGDTHSIVRTLEDWVPRLVATGRWQRAIATAMRAMNDAIDPVARAAMARLAAAAHLEAGHLSRAGVCVDTAVAIEQLTNGRPTERSVAVRAAVRLWQGRWQEGRAELEALPPDRLRIPEVAKWRELLAWAAGDERRQRWMPDVSGADADVWATAVRLFRAAAVGTRTNVCGLLGEPAAPRSRWESVIAAQAWLDLGDDDAAAAEIARCRVRGVAARGLVDVAAAAIRRGLSRAGADELQWLEAVTSRERLRGVVRWGQRRSSMQMLHDVSELLEIVQSCEEEAIGLRQVCAWTQASAGATACAIVSAPAGEAMAGDALGALGVERADVMSWLDRPQPALNESRTDCLARAPIRYGGCVVGLVLGAAPLPRARALFEAVQAAAVVSGAMLRARLDAISAAARSDALSRDIIGHSPAIEAVRAMAGRAAQAPFPVVIEGESGTGKELVARALHRLGPRRDRAFAALNCAALTDELIEAELFGHARGAFTHAVNARAGLFEDAHQGTLFLDEVGELSPRAQAKLLRVLQEGEIRRVGENESRPVDVRVIAATNRPLAALAAVGQFREDLMFRLTVIRIQVPPLRERAGDVPVLAMAFWRHAARRVGTRATLGPDALAALAQLSWPGNVRELQNALSALAVAAPATGRVGARLVRHVLTDLRAVIAPADTEIVPLDAARRDVERRLVSAALARHTGSRMAAAHALGLSRQGLSKAIRRLGLADAGVA